MKSAEPLNPAALAAVLAVQGIALKPGREERAARGVQDLLAAVAADPMRAALQFEADACGFAAVLSRAMR